MLIGTSGADRSKHVWRQAYRSIQHSHAKERFTNKSTMREFPKEIQDFGNVFVDAQKSRHKADYDPSFRVARSEVLAIATKAEAVIRQFRAVPIKDRRALAAWVTLVNRQ